MRPIASHDPLGILDFILYLTMYPVVKSTTTDENWNQMNGLSIGKLILTSEHTNALFHNVRKGSLVDLSGNSGISGEEASKMIKLLIFQSWFFGGINLTQQEEIIGITGKEQSNWLDEWNGTRIKLMRNLSRLDVSNTTIDGSIVPFSMISGLPYINIHPFTDTNWYTCSYPVCLHYHDHQSSLALQITFYYTKLI